MYGDISELKDNYDFLGWTYEPFTGNPDHVVLDMEGTDHWNELALSDSHDYLFKAKYVLHRFTIKFYNTPGELLDTLLVEYNTLPGTMPNPTVMPYKEFTGHDYTTHEGDTELFGDLTKCYALKGWHEVGIYNGEPNFNEQGSLLDFSKLNVVKDHTFIAEFQEASVYDTVLSSDYYNLEYDSSTSGYILSLKATQETKSPWVRGKICLPTTGTLNGVTRPITKLTGFANSRTSDSYQIHGITHIFWQKENRACVELLTSCFQRSIKLEYVEMPETLQIVGMNAFSGCEILGSYWTDDMYMAFSKNITEYNSSCFSTCKKFAKMYFSGNTKIIQSGILSQMDMLSYIQFGDANTLFGDNWARQDWDSSYGIMYQSGNGVQGAKVINTTYVVPSRMTEVHDYIRDVFKPSAGWEY